MTHDQREFDGTSVQSVETSAEPDRRTVVAGAAAGLLTALAGLPGMAEAQQLASAETPVGAKWWPSKWGAEDQAGASNHITPAKILDALKSVKSGKVYELGRLYESSMPKFGDRAFTLRIPGAPTGGPLGNNRVIWNDEFLSTEIGQVGTQFDGLGHIGVAVKGEDKSEMRFYNGFTVTDIASPTGLKKLGMEHVKPIITRGWLFNIAATKGRRMNLGEEIKVADIEAAMKRQNINASDIKPGDALFFHTGWGALWGKDNVEFGKGEPGIGLEAGAWCIKQQPCVVGADTWGVEVVPNPDSKLAFPVHQELLVKNGIFIHENLDFTDLANDTVNSFAYLMMPLRIKGATGSPGRPIALV
ncbi:MAG TPA: cyclase family protein [Hyphomicrobiaceae bacterium]|nr:cyclase family protein [Hyphomicrobiaceae bacterium]